MGSEILGDKHSSKNRTIILHPLPILEFPRKVVLIAREGNLSGQRSKLCIKEVQLNTKRNNVFKSRTRDKERRFHMGNREMLHADKKACNQSSIRPIFLWKMALKLEGISNICKIPIIVFCNSLCLRSMHIRGLILNTNRTTKLGDNMLVKLKGMPDWSILIKQSNGFWIS